MTRYEWNKSHSSFHPSDQESGFCLCKKSCMRNRQAPCASSAGYPSLDRSSNNIRSVHFTSVSNRYRDRSPREHLGYPLQGSQDPAPVHCHGLGFEPWRGLVLEIQATPRPAEGQRENEAVTDTVTSIHARSQGARGRRQKRPAMALLRLLAADLTQHSFA